MKKKKEYNSRPETRERKKELQRQKNKLYKSVKQFMPDFLSGKPLSPDRLEQIARQVAKIEASASDSAKTPQGRKALMAAGIASLAKTPGS